MINKELLNKYKENKRELCEEIFKICSEYLGDKSINSIKFTEGNNSSVTTDSLNFTNYINYTSYFEISTTIKPIPEYYICNKFIKNISDIFKCDISDIIFLIYSCLHEIGHAVYSVRLINAELTNREKKNYIKFRKIMKYNSLNKIFTNLQIEKEKYNKLSKLLYKNKYTEMYADMFAYAHLFDTLFKLKIIDRDEVIKTKINIKLNKNIVGKLLAPNKMKFIRPYKTGINNMKKDEGFYEHVKFFIESLFPDGDGENNDAYYILYVGFYSDMTKVYGDNDTKSIVLNIWKDSIRLFDIIGSQYKNKKWIDKDYILMNKIFISMALFVENYNKLASLDKERK